MIDILSVENMRASDAATIAGGTPGRELMARAGKGIFRAVEQSTGWRGPVAIVCGSGNNAGDGYVLAIFLTDAGVPCKLFLISEKFSEDGRYYYDKCMQLQVPCEKLCEEKLPGAFAGYPVIVDCILGTGFKGEVKDFAAQVIREINRTRRPGRDDGPAPAGETGSGREPLNPRTPAYVISVDINSGLNGDNGLVGGREEAVCVESDLTVSIGSFQPGHFLSAAKDIMKDKVNCPIGINPVQEPYRLLEARDVAAAFPKRLNLSNKGSYGYVTLMGGSGRYCGAIRLAALAQSSLLSGAGVATAAVPASIANIVACHVLESTIYPLPDRDGEIECSPEALEKLTGNRRALAFGMGIGTGEGARRSLEWLLANYEGRLIVDADGLNLLTKMPADIIRESRPKLILTPHVKEFERLLRGASATPAATGAQAEPETAGATGAPAPISISQILHDPINLAREYAARMNLTLLLKGPATIVTDGSRVLLTDRGCPGMATAGSGDVLSGILCGLASYMEDAVLASAAAAFINGYAGEMAQQATNVISQLASDTIRFIGPAITEILGEKS